MFCTVRVPTHYLIYIIMHILMYNLLKIVLFIKLSYPYSFRPKDHSNHHTVDKRNTKIWVNAIRSLQPHTFLLTQFISVCHYPRAVQNKIVSTGSGDNKSVLALVFTRISSHSNLILFKSMVIGVQCTAVCCLFWIDQIIYNRSEE